MPQCLRYNLLIFSASMKKSKSKSKPKPKVKQAEMNDQENFPKCGVCRTDLKPSHSAITCEDCRRTTHVSCYNSEIPASRRIFACDMCRHKKRKQYCVLCRQYGDVQILKSIEGTNLYIHVECAILSPSVQVQSYSKLSFISRGDIEKANKPTTKCSTCGENGFGLMINCVGCSKKGHFRCWIAQFGNQNYTLYRWLDKFEKYDFLLSYILGKKKTNLKTIIQMPTKVKELPLAVCSDHSQSYPFCYCNNPELSINRQNQDYICEICGRWVHQPCSHLPPQSDEFFKCEGCNQDDPLKRELKLPDLLAQIVKIEKSDKLNQRSIKLLNSLPLKYSGQLEKKIMESLRQIELYFAKRQVIRLLETSTIDQKKKKKIIQLLLVLNYGDKWKEQETQYLKEDFESSKIVFTILNFKQAQFSKEIQQKITQIFRPKANKNSKCLNQFKQQVKSFIKQFRSVTVNNTREIEMRLAFALKDIQVKFTEVQENCDENQKNFLLKFKQLMAGELFGILISKRFISVETISSALGKARKINYYMKDNTQITEKLYYSILDESNLKIPITQVKIWSEIMDKLRSTLDKLQIVYDSVKKEQAYKKYENQIKESPKSINLINRIEQQCINESICTVSNENTFMALKMKSIEQNVMKKKILSMCRKKDRTLSENNFKDISRIQQFLKKKSTLFSQKQLQEVNSYIGKLQFLSNILKKGESLQQYLIYDPIREETVVNEDDNPDSIGPLFLKLFHILDNWDEKILPSEFVISELFNKCVQKKVVFTSLIVEERIKAFMRFLANRCYNIIEEGRKIFLITLKKYVKVFEYLKIDEQFPYFVQLYERVKKWMSLFSADQRPDLIALFLQKPDKVANLIRTLEIKLSTASEIEEVNLSFEINKLCLLRQWCRLTEKIQILSKSKATINSIQTLKSLMQKVQYPQNTYMKRVIDLQNESKNLNKEVVKFLEKPRALESKGFYEEVKFIFSKMTLEEGYNIKSLLDRSNLDVYVETQELENEIRQFQTLPSDLVAFSERKSLVQLNITRRKLLESCFKVSNVEEYEKFLKKIYTLRCLHFEPPVTKQEYFQLLTIGGAAAIQFQAKTSELLKAYKTIQKAQLESANRKKNYNNLIPWSQQKCRQIRQGLKPDNVEQTKFEKARIFNAKLREQYLQLRVKKGELDRYKEFEIELSNSIFSNRDLIGEIFTLRSELEKISRRVQELLPYHIPCSQPLTLQNVFKRERGLIEVYNSIKIRHLSVEKFQFDYRMYFHTEQLRQSINLDNYKTYCDACSRMSDLAAKIPEILHTRTVIFQQMYREAMNGKPSILMCQTLINQGLQLRRLGSIQKDLIFEKIFQLYGYLKDLNREQEQGESENEMEEGRRQRQRYDSEDDNQQQNENDNEEEDEEDDDLGIDDDDEDEDEEDEGNDQLRNMDESDESSPEDEGNGNGNRKGNRGNNQIVLDSD